MIQAVIFDMDGLMIDSERITYQLYQQELKKLGQTMNVTFYCTMLGKNKQAIYDIFYEKYGLDLPMDMLRDVVHEKIDTRIIKEKPLKEGLIALLSYLKDNDYKTAIATSSTKNRVEILLPTLGLDSYFDTIVCGDEVKRSKPYPDIFLKAAEKLQVNPTHALVLEDSESGLKAAQAAHMKAICIPDMKYPNEASDAFILESLNKVISFLPTL